MPMKTDFLKIAEKYNMFQKGDTVIVGLSGGADSICLTDLLLDCRDELGITVEAAHLNHCIRGEEALRDEYFVRDFCKERNIVFHCKRVDIPSIAAQTGDSTELCARKIRYEFFNSLLCDKIATAHTGSDRIETMLMNLARGSALNGLCSIPPVRENIVRPLIEFTREDIEDYCAKKGLSYVTDSTNLTVDYTRNKFRHNVIGELKKINPSFEKNALRCIDSINIDNEFLNSHIDGLLAQCSNGKGELKLENKVLSDKRLLPRIIVLYLSQNCNSDFEKKHIDFIIENLGKNFSLTLPGGKTVSGNSKMLYFEPEKQFEEKTDLHIELDLTETFSYSDKEKHISVYITDEYTEPSDNTFVADVRKCSGKIILRTRAAGDVFHPEKRKCSKTLKKLFNEEAVPITERDRLFILSDDSGLIFLEKFGIDSLHKPNGKTDKYLIIKFEDDQND